MTLPRHFDTEYRKKNIGPTTNVSSLLNYSPPPYVENAMRLAVIYKQNVT